MLTFLFFLCRKQLCFTDKREYGNSCCNYDKELMPMIKIKMLNKHVLQHSMNRMLCSANGYLYYTSAAYMN